MSTMLCTIFIVEKQSRDCRCC